MISSAVKKVVTKLFLKIIDREFFNEIIDPQKLEIRLIDFKSLSKCNSVILGDKSKFYDESKVTNLQYDSSKITIGNNTHIRGHLQIFSQGGRIEIGNDCYVGEDTRIWSARSIKIGNRVLISHNVNIHDNISHPINHKDRHKDFLRILGENNISSSEFDLRANPVVIGDDVWIGFNVTILKGVRIGNGCILGAETVITKDIPDWSMVVGNPARIIKQIDN